MEKMTEKDGSSLNIVNENLKALKAIFPEAFTEDGVDFEALRQLLGDAVDEGDEKYGLTWHGKKKARQIALMPSLGTLRPCPEESVDWDTTQNLFIEGDNLEVLKLLQKSYANKVKMIYIDPPYNTGKEFIYPDKFQDNLDTYLRYTGQKNDEGFKLSSNTESSGRFHTNWLNMMYPRLKLARNLLRDDGVIFISIDDGEVANLRKICDEIFGEENFVANVVWQKKYGPANDAKGVSQTHEHILVYAKNSQCWLPGLLPRDETQLKAFENPDNDPRGHWRASDLSARTYNVNCDYEIIGPNGDRFVPPASRAWIVSKEKYEELLNDNRITFGISGSGRPMQKKFLSEVKDGITPETWWNRDKAGDNKIARYEMKELFPENVFDTPKPSKLIFYMSKIANVKNNDSILDFFAGSCTTAHAVLDLNNEDGGNRKFIMVQLPEPCDEKSEAFKAGYKTIADIGKERIRRVIKNLRLQIDGLGLEEAKKQPTLFKGDDQQSKIKNLKSLDLGFKVFKLDSSNIRVWNPDRNDLEQTLFDHIEHLVEGRSEEDVLYELLLKRGVELTVPIEKREVGRKEIEVRSEKLEGSKTARKLTPSSFILTPKIVYSIGYGALFACLTTEIKQEEVEDLAMGIIDWHKELEPAGDTQVVFRDSAFEGDIAKTNMAAILEQHGIKHVRSL